MHSLRFRLGDVRRLQRRADALELTAGAEQRLKWFAYLASHGGNVSLTCRHFGIARSTLQRWIDRFDPLHPETLEETSRRPHRVREAKTDPRLVEHVAELRRAEPSLGKTAIRERLLRQHGIDCSASTIGRIINRNKLFFGDTPSHREKRGEGIEEIAASPIVIDPKPDAAGASGLVPYPGLPTA